MAGPLGAAGVALGAFGAVAVPVLSKVRGAQTKLTAAREAYAKATTTSGQASALKAEQQATAELTGSQMQMLHTLQQLSATFTRVENAASPMIEGVLKLAVTTARGLLPALRQLAPAGARIIGAFLVPLNALLRSPLFARFTAQMTTFAVRVGALVGPQLVRLLAVFIRLFIRTMPAGLQILQALLPAIVTLVTDLAPVIVVMAQVVAATVHWLAKSHLLVGAIGAVAVAVGLLMGASGIGAVTLLITGLIVVSVELYKHWGTIWGFMLRIVKDVWGWIKDHWPLLVTIIAGPIGAAAVLIAKHWRGILTGAQNLWGWLKTGFRVTLDAVKVAWNTVTGFFSRLWDGVRKVFRLAWDYIKLGALGAVKTVLDGFSHIPIIGHWFSKAADAVGAAMRRIQGNINHLQGTTVHVGVRMTAASNPYAGGISGRAATGGEIRGPGGPTGDRAGLYALSDKEWVIRSRSAQGYGHAAMRAVNEGRAVIRYSGGGQVGPVRGMAAGGPVDIKARADIHPSTGTIRDQMAHIVERYAIRFAKTFMGGGAAIVNYAMRYLHRVPYVWSGTTPSGWDCSGFTGWVYRHQGYPGIPRTSQQQQSWARPSGSVPGALVFFYGRGGTASHVGINLGGGRYIGADDPALGTTIQPTAGNTGFGVPPGGFRGGPGAGGGVGGGGTAVELGRSMAAGLYGWRGRQWSALFDLWQRESRWNPRARNQSSGAAGIPQDITGNFHGGAAGQIRWGLNYIRGRYGTPARAWAHELAAGWYDRGGYLPPGLSLAFNGTGRPEPVGEPAGGGNTYNINVHVAPGGHPAETGRQIVQLVQQYEKRSGASWRKN